MSEALDIPVALVQRLVSAQFPEWADLPIRPVASPGWDNMTYRLGDGLSVRLPRFERWVGQVEREQTWLPRLAPHLPLPIPVPRAVGAPGEGYPFPWSVYEWLDGEPVAPGTLRADELAAFLAALQAIDATEGPPPQSSNGFRGAALADERDSPVVAARVRARIAALDGLAGTDSLTAVWEAGLAAPQWHGPGVWVHGDPAPTNLLAAGGRLTAVIDFGTLAVGDPAVDLIAAWTVVRADAREAFRAALGVDDATWARGRVWGLVAMLPHPAELAGAGRELAARRRIDGLLGRG
ncbi:MAG: aminoglycoside phosphotransferase family protein [Solirubrobacteraceae bacterium]